MHTHRKGEGREREREKERRPREVNILVQKDQGYFLDKTVKDTEQVKGSGHVDYGVSWLWLLP